MMRLPCPDYKKSPSRGGGFVFAEQMELLGL